MRWANVGKLPAIKLPNGVLRLREDELAQWLESRSTSG
jgi:predicted site-specific integrase-resolvase